jgi:hypothetical protein
MRDSGQPPYSHSIIKDEFTTLISKHKLSRLADKFRQNIRFNLLILNSQENSRRLQKWRLR